MRRFISCHHYQISLFTYVNQLSYRYYRHKLLKIAKGMILLLLYLYNSIQYPVFLQYYLNALNQTDIYG